ncbi:MAG TPA: hypothetical protein VGF20_04880 [Candidatus Acidoferrum sp.]|jgi:hypothetical protein
MDIRRIERDDSNAGDVLTWPHGAVVKQTATGSRVAASTTVELTVAE